MIVVWTRADFFDAPLSLTSLAVAPLWSVDVEGAVLESFTSTSELMVVRLVCMISIFYLVGVGLGEPPLYRRAALPSIYFL